MLWTKKGHQCTILRLFGVLMKVHPIPHAIFQSARSGFVQILHQLQITPLYFLAQTSYTLDKNSPLEFWEIGWKLTKLLMSNLKSHVSFSLNFASLFSAMGDKSSVLFYLKLYLIFTKGAHHSAKFQTFDCSGEISPNLYFDRLLLLKVYKVSAKKSMEEICLMIPKSGAKFEEKLIFCFKNDKNLVNFDLSTKKSKKFALWLVPFVQSIQRLT